jgi:hypothetical protein
MLRVKFTFLVFRAKIPYVEQLLCKAPYTFIITAQFVEKVNLTINCAEIMKHERQCI